MRKSLLKLILNDCRKELLDHPQFNFFPHWTYLIRNNEILCYGMNHSEEPSKKFGYHNHVDPTFRPKFHSELDCIRKCRRGLHDLEVVNVRLNKLGNPRLSMPCRACRNLLGILDVKKIYFTTELGWGVI